MERKQDKDISRMKAKVIRVFDTTGLASAYWGKYIGKTYKVVKIMAKNNGDTTYLLDMGKDGVKLWYSNEIELIDDGVPLEVAYGS
jgi:hypothetical protein